MMKIVWPLVILTAVVTMTGCGKLSGKSKGNGKEKHAVTQDTIPIQVKRIEPQNFIVRGEYYGDVEGIVETKIICVGGGHVDELNAREGSWVSAGKSLGKIDAEEALTRYETAELNEKVDRNNYERLKLHLQDGNASQLTVDQAHLKWLSSKSALQQADKARKGALCITPISGIVVSRHIELHQEIPPGTPTFTVSQLRRVKVTFGIPEKDIAGVEVGNKATINFDLFPEREWEGKVTRLSREISPRNRTFQAQLEIDNKDGTLMSGVTAHILLQLRTLENRIVVPTGAVRTENQEHYVMIEENGVSRMLKVDLGPSDQTQTVIEKGIQPGMHLIVAGQHLAADGSRVAVQN